MGLIGTVISYYVFCLVNVWCASLLVKVNEYTRKNVGLRLTTPG